MKYFATMALMASQASATHEGIPIEIQQFKGWMRTYLSGNSTTATGGEQCENDLTVTDAYGDSCEWYTENADSCGAYDSDDFSAAFLCCACGGGNFGDECSDQDNGITDLYGDSCEWYTDNFDSCGVYDGGDFTAALLCCGCGGGLFNEVTPTTTGSCVNDDSVTDAYGDDCEWYSENIESCGAYDDDDFTASVACCSCGADASTSTSGTCVDDDSVTDAYGDDCIWYSENTESCGAYDDADFIATIACCACGRGGSTSESG